jgi:predicted  nucleic acid-binding Zn-ribbon protein
MNAIAYMNDLELISRSVAIFIGVSALLGTIWKLIDVFISQRNEIAALKTACNAFVKEIDFRQLQNEHTHLRNSTTEALVTLELGIKKVEADMLQSAKDRQHFHSLLEDKMNKIFDQLTIIKVDIAKITK